MVRSGLQRRLAGYRFQPRRERFCQRQHARPVSPVQPGHLTKAAAPRCPQTCPLGPIWQRRLIQNQHVAGSTPAEGTRGRLFRGRDHPGLAYLRCARMPLPAPPGAMLGHQRGGCLTRWLVVPGRLGSDPTEHPTLRAGGLSVLHQGAHHLDVSPYLGGSRGTPAKRLGLRFDSASRLQPHASGEGGEPHTRPCRSRLGNPGESLSWTGESRYVG